MSLSCNAVGDVLALIELATVIVNFLNDCRGAPAECRALCNELRSLERLLALSKPTILALRNNDLRELVMERMRVVSSHIEEGLRLIVKFSSAFDVSVAGVGSAGTWRTTLLRWETKASQSICWTLRRSADVKACRVAITQSIEPLSLSLHIAFQADQAAVARMLQEAFTGLADDVQAGYAKMHRLAAAQEALQVDTLSLKEAFDKHLMALRSIREEVSGVRMQFTDILSTARLDIADVRNDLTTSTQTVVDTIARESTSTRARLDTFFATVSDDRLADRSQLTTMDSKLDQVLRLLVQQATKGPTVGSVQHHRFPGVQQLRVASFRIQELSSLYLPVILRAVVSDEAITTALVLAMTASNSADREVYGIAAFVLVVARKAGQLYNVPATVHVVFVEDLFGYALEIPASKCSNPQDFHAALIMAFEGRMGFVLIQRRKYELRLAGSSTSTEQAAPWTWKHPMKPGTRIHMNTYVQRHNPAGPFSDFLICPACSARVIDPEQLSVPNHGWVACAFCPAMVQVSRKEVARNAENVEPLHKPTAQGPNNPSVSTIPSTSSISAVKHKFAGDSEEETALRRCRRIRVIQYSIFKGMDGQRQLLTQYQDALQQRQKRWKLLAQLHSYAATRLPQQPPHWMTLWFSRPRPSLSLSPLSDSRRSIRNLLPKSR